MKDLPTIDLFPDLPVRYIKMKNDLSLLTYVTAQNETSITIKRPLTLDVDNDLDTGRQMILIKEWIPPIVTVDDYINIPMELVLFVMDVKEDFREEYVDVCNYFYSVKPMKRKGAVAKIKNKGDNVVPFIIAGDDDKIH